MHSQIAAVDLNVQDICYYNHAYGNSFSYLCLYVKLIYIYVGSPRVFNQAGATFYNNRFNGEAGERGIAQDDTYTEIIPASANYSHAGTAFYYYGYNQTSTGMEWEICWNEDGEANSPLCMPRKQGNTTPDQDHYYYFANVSYS